MNDKQYEKFLNDVRKRTRQRREQQDKAARYQAKLKMSHGLCCLSWILSLLRTY